MIGFDIMIISTNYPLDGTVQYTCPNHKEDDCNLDVVYDYEAIRHTIMTRGLSPEAGMSVIKNC